MLKIFLSSSLLLCTTVFAASMRDPIDSNRYQALSGQRKVSKVFTEKRGAEKKIRYYYGEKPSDFLTRNHLFISPNSRVLDINMELGHNAIFLGHKGHRVLGIEDDQKKLGKAKRQSRDFGVHLEVIEEGIARYLKRGETFDAIIAIDVMDRNVLSKAMKLLRPGGILIVEGPTISDSKLREFGGYPSKEHFTPGELLQLFRAHRIVAFREPNFHKRFRSSIIVEKGIAR